MKINYRCETCEKSIVTSDFSDSGELENVSRDALTGCEGEGIMDENMYKDVFNSLCSDCREEIWGRESSIMFFGSTFKH